MTNQVNVPALAHSIHPSVQLIEGRKAGRGSRKRERAAKTGPLPGAPLRDPAQEAAFFIHQLHGEIARKVLPALLQEMATGNACWRNTRWILQLTGDDQGKLSIPRLSALPAV